jgi:hypothetical protein
MSYYPLHLFEIKKLTSHTGNIIFFTLGPLVGKLVLYVLFWKLQYSQIGSMINHSDTLYTIHSSWMDYMYMYVVIPLCVMGVVVDKLFKIYTGDSGVVKVQYSQRHRHITHLGEMDYLVLLFSFSIYQLTFLICIWCNSKWHT